MTISLSVETMTDRARAVLDTLPRQFLPHTRDIVLQVEEFATAEQLASVGLHDRWHLSGLYEGRLVPLQSQWETGELPPRIWLFRMPLIAEARSTRVPIDELIRHVVVHEAGHHFGLTDAEMHHLEEIGT